jgi:hypothetical protein
MPPWNITGRMGLLYPSNTMLSLLPRGTERETRLLEWIRVMSLTRSIYFLRVDLVMRSYSPHSRPRLLKVYIEYFWDYPSSPDVIDRRIGPSTKIGPSGIFDECDWWPLVVSASIPEVVLVACANQRVQYFRCGTDF